MNTKELRIGNLFQDQSGNILKVTCIREDGYDFYVVDRTKFPLPDGWKALPIILTEEWFNRFKLNPSWYGWFNGSFYFRSNNPGDYSSIPCQYIHQLQNLYFAINGKELECF